MLEKDEKLQQFLRWVKQKSSSVDASYKPAAIRAFYCARVHAYDRIYNHTFNQLSIQNRVLFRVLGDNIEHALDHNFDFSSNPDLYLYCIIYYILELDYISKDKFKNIVKFISEFEPSLPFFDAKLRRKLQELKDDMPDTSKENRDHFKQWWQASGQAWTEQLRQVMIEHRNIGHDWQFSEGQEQLLQQYYDTNQLLVKCLNLPDIFVSPKVRQEIEETLLLPWEEVNYTLGSDPP